MTSSYSGRLELTWTNKDRTLLAHEDQTYEWVEPADYRVSEVRLLQDVASVGETAPQSNRASDNLLIRGDALHALNSLSRLPEFAKAYVGKVKLCYIDPPFNTGQAFEHYDDALEHSVWLTMLRDRLVQIKELLADDGSVWVHLDDAEVHRCRSVLDEVFGSENFVATVIWKRRNDPRNTAIHVSADHDFILCYAKSDAAKTFNRLARTDSMDSAYTNPDNDLRGPWRRGDLAARNYYSKGLYPVTTPSGRMIDGPPSGSYWRVSLEQLNRLNADGRIYWGPNGDSRPYLKRFLTDVTAGRVPSSVWHPEEVGFVRNGKEEVRALVGDVFATPKPERLLQRIIQMATDPADIVLDCYAGSGTTAAVAHKMGRRWITSEWSPNTVATFTMPRLQKVVTNEDPGGITSLELPTGDGLPEGVAAGAARDAAKTLDVFAKAGLLDDIEGIDERTRKALIKALRDADKTRKEVLWSGGGGFRVLEVGTSMFAEVDGQIYLADWAVNGALAEAVAAQTGFAYESDGPFSGLKGKSRLTVVDGLVNEGVVRLLLDALPERQTVSIYGTAIEPEARDVLRNLRRGSTLRKIPSALLSDYRKSSAHVSALTTRLDEVADTPADSSDSTDVKVNA